MHRLTCRGRLRYPFEAPSLVPDYEPVLFLSFWAGGDWVDIQLHAWGNTLCDTGDQERLFRVGDTVFHTLAAIVYEYGERR